MAFTNDERCSAGLQCVLYSLEKIVELLECGQIRVIRLYRIGAAEQEAGF